jgi:DNA-binding NtrC family response regulator
MTTTEAAERIPCTTCGTLIRPVTAKHTNGLCRPCFKELPGYPGSALPPYVLEYERFKASEKWRLPTLSTVSFNYDEIIAESEAMQRIVALVKRVAPSDAAVLISGEIGTGKKLVARAIHRLSKRNDQPFIAMNCAALPENLIESELFGLYRSPIGVERKPGFLERANGGTILLETISEIPLSVQGKLLHVFQTGEFKRFFLEEPIKVDLRVIATTTRNLADCVATGEFSQDLYTYMTGVVISLPPLRERREDIRRLLDFYLHTIVESFGIGPKKLAPDVLDFLGSYPWPGNFRELQAVLEISLLKASSDSVKLGDLPSEMRL